MVLILFNCGFRKVRPYLKFLLRVSLIRVPFVLILVRGAAVVGMVKQILTTAQIIKQSGQERHIPPLNCKC